MVAQLIRKHLNRVPAISANCRTRTAQMERMALLMADGMCSRSKAATGYSWLRLGKTWPTTKRGRVAHQVAETPLSQASPTRACLRRAAGPG
eukprot:2373506-Pyramimonas_sp.AAC.1